MVSQRQAQATAYFRGDEEVDAWELVLSHYNGNKAVALRELVMDKAGQLQEQPQVDVVDMLRRLEELEKIVARHSMNFDYMLYNNKGK